MFVTYTIDCNPLYTTKFEQFIRERWLARTTAHARTRALTHTLRVVQKTNGSVCREKSKYVSVLYYAEDVDRQGDIRLHRPNTDLWEAIGQLKRAFFFSGVGGLVT